MTDREVARTIMMAHLGRPDDQIDRARDMGREMFRMQSEQGLPPDIFLNEIKNKMSEATPEMTIIIVQSYLTASLTHKRTGGMSEGQEEKARDRNRAMMRRFIEKGEIGW